MLNVLFICDYLNKCKVIIIIINNKNFCSIDCYGFNKNELVYFVINIIIK